MFLLLLIACKCYIKKTINCAEISKCRTETKPMKLFCSNFIQLCSYFEGKQNSLTCNIKSFKKFFVRVNKETIAKYTWWIFIYRYGKICKRYDVNALTGSLYNIVNHLFTETTDDVL